MRHCALVLGVTAALFGLSACKKQASDNDAIRAGILQHLASIGTLNMSAMDMDLRSVAVTGNQAAVKKIELRAKSKEYGTRTITPEQAFIAICQDELTKMIAGLRSAKAS